MISVSNWFFWALLSAVFAALTAIFAKVGLQGVDSDLATLVRTFVIMAVLIVFVHVTRKWSNPFELSSRTWLFLVLSGLATGASWVCYFRALKIGEPGRTRTRINTVVKRSYSRATFRSFCIALSLTHFQVASRRFHDTNPVKLASALRILNCPQIKSRLRH